MRSFYRRMGRVSSCNVTVLLTFLPASAERTDCRSRAMLTKLLDMARRLSLTSVTEVTCACLIVDFRSSSGNTFLLRRGEMYCNYWRGKLRDLENGSMNYCRGCFWCGFHVRRYFAKEIYGSRVSKFCLSNAVDLQAPKYQKASCPSYHESTSTVTLQHQKDVYSK